MPYRSRWRARYGQRTLPVSGNTADSRKFTRKYMQILAEISSKVELPPIFDTYDV
jgi:hypothetical protein